jgi:pimeloyl-ACP methyl ester carboxylesterase
MSSKYSFIAALGVAASMATVACSSSHPSGSGGAAVPNLAIACADPLGAVYAPDHDPGVSDPARRGEIVRCAVESSQDDAAFNAWATGLAGHPLAAPAAVGGVRTLRLTYRTTRATPSHTPGLSSAQVFLPNRLRAGPAPIVVVAHFSVGQGAACAPSLGRGGPRDSLYAANNIVVAPLVAAGYAVIASDFAGYIDDGTGIPPSYLDAEDAAYSNLDAARALRHVLGAAAGNDVFLVGQSAGGTAVLSALALEQSYGSGGAIAGVALYSPVWFDFASFFVGALKAPQSFPVAAAPEVPNAGMIWYHLSRGELTDGRGHGTDVIAPSKRAAMQAFFDTSCWGSTQAPLQAIGSDASEFYDPTFLAAFAAAPSPSPTLDRWLPRYQADRPHLKGAALRVPIVFRFGGADTLVPPPLMRCAAERLASDGAMLDIDMVPNGGHAGPGAPADVFGPQVAAWVGSIAYGTAAPARGAGLPASVPACPLPHLD